jgi:hypothetical protein
MQHRPIRAAPDFRRAMLILLMVSGVSLIAKALI